MVDFSAAAADPVGAAPQGKYSPGRGSAVHGDQQAGIRGVARSAGAAPRTVHYDRPGNKRRNSDSQAGQGQSPHGQFPPV